MAFGTPGSRQGRGCLTRLGVGSAVCRSHGAKHFPSAARTACGRSPATVSVTVTWCLQAQGHGDGVPYAVTYNAAMYIFGIAVGG
jgi:hypothetical protein